MGKICFMAIAALVIASALHMHNGICYYGHSADDGHAYHSCGVDDCTIAEAHRHESAGYWRHSGGRHHH